MPPGCLLGASWVPSGCLLDASWVLCGFSGCLLGASWELPGPPECLWALLGASLGTPMHGEVGRLPPYFQIGFLLTLPSLKVDLPKSRSAQKLTMEVKFAAAAANFADFNNKIGANVAGARNGGEICRGGGKFRRLVHASKRLLYLSSRIK